MKFTKFNVLETHFYVGFDEKGYTFIGSPIGDENEINDWFDENEYVEYSKRFNDIKEELTEYLNGQLKDFSIPIHMIGTDFQISVWKKLLKIPYGTTVSYREIAIRMGDKNKTRAIATAIAKNPLLMVIPCHRVIGNDGKLRGFRAGLTFKEKLLALEKYS